VVWEDGGREPSSYPIGVRKAFDDGFEKTQLAHSLHRGRRKPESRMSKSETNPNERNSNDLNNGGVKSEVRWWPLASEHEDRSVVLDVWPMFRRTACSGYAASCPIPNRIHGSSSRNLLCT